MHTYSINKDIRIKVSIIIFVISMILSFVLGNVFTELLNNFRNYIKNSDVAAIVTFVEWLDVTPNVFGPLFLYGCLYAFYDRIAWKWSVFSKFHKIPDLNGIWQGNLKSSFNNRRIRMKMEIEQSWSKIKFISEFPDTHSKSYSNVAAIVIDGESGMEIYFGYKNESSDLTSGMQVHYGYNILTLTSERHIHGRYFNDRQNPNANIKGGNKGGFELDKI